MPWDSSEDDFQGTVTSSSFLPPNVIPVNLYTSVHVVT